MTNKTNAAVSKLQSGTVASTTLGTGDWTGDFPTRSGKANAPDNQPCGIGFCTPSAENSMGNAIDAAYRRNPDLRAQVECEAHMTRDKEMDRLVVAPLRKWLVQPSKSLLGAVVAGGLLVASCGPGGSDAYKTAVAPTRAVADREVAIMVPLERLDHSKVNQNGATHDSDVPGVSIAAY